MKRKLPIFISCLFISLVFFACKQPKLATKTDQEIVVESSQSEADESSSTELKNQLVPTKAELKENASYLLVEDSLLLKIQKTPCFGLCPVYTASIFKNGTVLYSGIKRVENIGFFSAKMELDSIQALIQEAKRINFEDFQIIYNSIQVTDLPSVITTVRFEEQVKAVVNRYQGPISLGKFEAMIENTINRLEYKAIEK